MAVVVAVVAVAAAVVAAMAMAMAMGLAETAMAAGMDSVMQVETHVAIGPETD